MGKKKKGGGAEKTAAKTDKKLAQKIKKQLELSGEDEISAIVAQIEKEEQKKLRVIEKVISSPPTRRAYFSLVAHPDKDDLILFGGEFYNGKETEVYNDLFVYKIAKDEWRIIRSPGGPAPRSGHQSVAVSGGGGQMWTFGGEFTTKSESQFYHYKDLWVLHLDSYKWEKIQTTGGPSSRSGHRMVALKRQLVVFGGYHDNLQDYKYFDDVHIFNLDSRIWSLIKPSGNCPAPRSACQMVTTPEGKILIWGGYSKVKVKKDVEQGLVHKDTFLLAPDKHDTSGQKWRWSNVKPGGMRPEPLSGVAVASWGTRAYTFGGAADRDSEEDIAATFYNDLYSLDLTNLIWSEVTLSGKKKSGKSKRRRKDKTEECGEEEMEECDEPEGDDDDMETEEPKEEIIENDDGFTLKIGGPSSESSRTPSAMDSTSVRTFNPHARINAGLVLKQSRLYLYSGIFEDGSVTYTLSDFHVLDVQKADEWKELIPCDLKSQEWLGSDSSDSDDEGEEDIEEDDEDESEDED